MQRSQRRRAALVVGTTSIVCIAALVALLGRFTEEPSESKQSNDRRNPNTEVVAQAPRVEETARGEVAVEPSEAELSIRRTIRVRSRIELPITTAWIRDSSDRTETVNVVNPAAIEVDPDSVAIRILGHRETNISSEASEVTLEPIAALVVRGEGLRSTTQAARLMPQFDGASSIVSTILSGFVDDDAFALAWDPRELAQEAPMTAPLTIEFTTRGGRSIRIERDSRLEGITECSIDASELEATELTGRLEITFAGATLGDGDPALELLRLDREQESRTVEFEWGTISSRRSAFRERRSVPLPATSIGIDDVPIGGQYVATALASDGTHGRRSFTHSSAIQSMELFEGSSLRFRLIDGQGQVIPDPGSARIVLQCFTSSEGQSSIDATAWRSEFRAPNPEESTNELRCVIPSRVPLTELASFPCPKAGSLTIEHPHYERKVVEFGPVTSRDTDLGAIQLEDFEFAATIRGGAEVLRDDTISNSVLFATVNDHVLAIGVRGSRAVGDHAQRLRLDPKDLVPDDRVAAFAMGELRLPAIVLAAGEDRRYFELANDGTYAEVGAIRREVTFVRADASTSRLFVLGANWRGIAFEFEQIPFVPDEARRSITAPVARDALELWWADFDRTTIELHGPKHAIPITSAEISIPIP